MKQVNILVIGRHTAILETVLRLINQHPDWQASGSIDDAEAIQLFQQQRFDLVLLGGGVSKDDEQALRSTFRLQNPQIKIVQHWGGGSGLLSNEIEAALRGGRVFEL